MKTQVSLLNVGLAVHFLLVSLTEFQTNGSLKNSDNIINIFSRTIGIFWFCKSSKINLPRNNSN